MEARSRFRMLFSVFVLLVIYFSAAAATFSGFFGKWALRDGSPRFGIAQMMDGTAERPFVYRQLVPLLADGLARVVPGALQDKLAAKFDPETVFARAKPAVIDQVGRFRYAAVYYLTFLSILASLFLLRAINLQLGLDDAAATFGPLAFMLLVPYLQTVGGYYYDLTELFFCALAALLALQGRVVWLALVTLLATLNKETFFFFLFAIYPLLRVTQDTRKSALVVVGLILISGLVNVATKTYFAANPGGMLEFHMVINLESLLHPHDYLLMELTYGLVGPAQLSALVILLFGGLAWLTWGRLPKFLRQHLAILFPLNVVLFLLFCWPGEMRNFSLLFVDAAILMSYFLQGYMQSTQGLPQRAVRG